MHFKIYLLSWALGLSICCCPVGYYTVRDNPACFTFLRAKNFEDGVEKCRNASGIPYKIPNIFVNKNLYLWSNSSTRVIADEYYLGIRRRDEVWLYWDGSRVDYLHWGPATSNLNRTVGARQEPPDHRGNPPLYEDANARHGL
ncbi:unnamed protein product, partial [Mesorhabditis spiculigera]